MFNLIYSPQKKVEAVEKSGVKLPFDPATKSFDEVHPLVQELRHWERENNIDLVAWGNRDRSIEEAPPKGDRLIETDATGVVEKEWSFNGSSYVSLPMRSSFNCLTSSRVVERRRFLTTPTQKEGRRMGLTVHRGLLLM